MALDTRELFARLIQCEAGGEGTAGMQAVATVIMNRATTTVGEFARVNNGGDVRAIITQPGQFVCMRETVGGRYNAQNVYNMTPTQEHYDIVDWALDGGRLLFMLIEFIRRKPIPPEKEGMVHAAGMLLLLLLVVFVSFNDVMRLIK